VEAADLANIELASQPRLQLSTEEVGVVLHFETLPDGFLTKFSAVANSLSESTLVWIMQETRQLHWSESTLIALLDSAVRKRFVRRVPNYSTDDLQTLLNALSGTDAVITSRYHAGLVAAWQGSRVALYCRNEKLRGLATQFDISTFEDFGEGIETILSRSRRVSRSALLRAAANAEAASEAFFSAVLG
jgi:polysaccharide pyruvyl transferase WcaK-like protein